MRAGMEKNIIPIIITNTVEKATKDTSRNIITKKEKRDTTTKRTILDIITKMKAIRSIIITMTATTANTTRERKVRRVINSMRKDIMARATALRDITKSTNLTNLRKIRNSSTNIMIMVIMKNTVAIIMNTGIRRAVTLRKDTMIIIITRTIMARKVIMKKDTIITIIKVIKAMAITRSIIIIIPIMARRAAMKITSIGDSKRDIDINMKIIILLLLLVELRLSRCINCCTFRRAK